VVLWVVYVVQFALAALAVALSAMIARQKRSVWLTICLLGLAMMLLWPLMRVFPTVAIDVLGAKWAACVEITGLFVPAALVFSVAARRVPRESDRRAVLALVVVAGAFFAWSGRWMLWHRLPDLGPTQMHANVCKQSTDYTCVAASMVTLLKARGIETSEQEMAERAFVQVGGGATDSRALWALERTLVGTGLKARYATMTLGELIAAEKPALVQLDWGFFTSHMVPVMHADEKSVTIGDPLMGLKVMAAGEFARLWKKQAIVVDSLADQRR
jgi:predicted double-glycine peptidase